MEYKGVEKDSTTISNKKADDLFTLFDCSSSSSDQSVQSKRSTGCHSDEVAPRLFGYRKGCFLMVDQSDQSIEVTITCIALNTPTTSALNAIDQLISQPDDFFLRQNCTRGAPPINYSWGSLMAMRYIALKLSTSISLVHELPSLILDALTLHLHIVECSNVFTLVLGVSIIKSELVRV